MCVYACLYVWMWTESWMNYVHNLGCFAARFMWSYSLGNQTLRTSACVTLINSAILYIKINVFEKIKLSIDVCVYACMYVWICTEFWMKYVHNLGCFAARCLWSYSLGNLTLRTSAFWIWILENIKKHTTHHDTHMYVYIFCIYTYLWKKTQTINKCACVHAAYMYVWMYGCMYRWSFHHNFFDIYI